MLLSVWNFILGVLGHPLTHLGSLEGDYRSSNLKTDITQSLVYMTLVGVSILLMVTVDAALFQDRPNQLRLMVLARLSYLVMTILFAMVLHRTRKVLTYDRLSFGWIFLTILYIVLFNFTRPQNYISASIDVVVLFSIYMLSPLAVSYTFILASCFSIGTLYVGYFFKPGVDPFALTAAAYAQMMVHLLGLAFVIQFQSHRRKSFRAYIDEKDAKEMVTYLASIDTLTRSATRRHFLNMAETEFLRFHRYRRVFSILIIDADYFKQINDTYGHHAGDLALRSLSLVAMEQKRAQDTLGRLGGEEFGLLMPETNLQQALIVAERIRQAWEQSPVMLDGKLIHSTMSIGAAEASPDDQSLEDILRRADRMVYKAKEHGRNRVTSE